MKLGTARDNSSHREMQYKVIWKYIQTKAEDYKIDI
jgi:hypothetical protein